MATGRAERGAIDSPTDFSPARLCGVVSRRVNTAAGPVGRTSVRPDCAG
jgi:hypothetical protein